jgi:hypothetical protein
MPRKHERRTMKHYTLTPEERETIIRTSEADDCWYVFSESPAVIRQLRALVERVGGEEEPAQTTTGYRCVLPKRAVNALVAKRQYRPLTEQERQARVARLHGRTASNAGRMEEEMANA